MADQRVDPQLSRSPLRRLGYAVLFALALAPAIAGVGYVVYSGMLAKESSQQVSLSYDGFYWDGAQLEIAYDRLISQVLLYRSGIDADFDGVRLRYDAVESRLNTVASSTSTLANHDALRSRQQEILRRLNAALLSIEPDLDDLRSDPSRALRIVGVLRQNQDAVNELASGRRGVDVAERENLARDFVAKRRYLFAVGALLALLSVAATVTLLLNGYRRSRLIHQQRAALEAQQLATRAAREASQAKDAFLGMISHELRTPLHAIVSSVELLELNLHSEADRRIIQRLETGARHLEAQMRDLTDYARLGAGKLELRLTVFDPLELLDSIIDANTPAATAKGLVLSGKFAGEHGLVESDQHRLRQIVTNLVTNAIKYTDAGSIDVRFERSLARLDISVIDTGPGIAREQLPLIFKEFTQLDSSTTRRFDGAGMGLAVVRGLVELMGGVVNVSSDFGHGAAFRVSLPASPASARPDREMAAELPLLKQARVLVIDDHDAIRESLTEMLTHLGYAGAAVGDVDAALAWLDANEADVILADLHMPGKDGYSFVAEYRARREPGASVPVIAVSAYAPDLVDPGAAILFFDYLLKPVRYEVLKSALQRAVSATRLVH
jgi:signal transduction histidine kinase/ActR/RegA family two-component response regulator